MTDHCAMCNRFAIVKLVHNNYNDGVSVAPTLVHSTSSASERNAIGKGGVLNTNTALFRPLHATCVTVVLETRQKQRRGIMGRQRSIRRSKVKRLYMAGVPTAPGKETQTDNEDMTFAFAAKPLILSSCCRSWRL